MQLWNKPVYKKIRDKQRSVLTPAEGISIYPQSVYEMHSKKCFPVAFEGHFLLKPKSSKELTLLNAAVFILRFKLKGYFKKENKALNSIANITHRFHCCTHTTAFSHIFPMLQHPSKTSSRLEK